MVDTPYRGGLVLLSLLTSNTSVVIVETLGRIARVSKGDANVPRWPSRRGWDMVDWFDLDQGFDVGLLLILFGLGHGLGKWDLD
ncbi:hypothetical protein Tco_1238635 [Tanacetum coccineum]